MAKLLAGFLNDVGVRESDTIVETTGEEVMREGPQFLKDKLGEAEGGTLLIDDW